jgi:hypothetical protein
LVAAHIGWAKHAHPGSFAIEHDRVVLARPDPAAAVGKACGRTTHILRRIPWLAGVLAP